jgi:hypothetical protein
MAVAHDIKWLVCLLMQSMAVCKMTGINIEGVSKDVVVRCSVIFDILREIAYMEESTGYEDDNNFNFKHYQHNMRSSCTFKI